MIVVVKFCYSGFVKISGSKIRSAVSRNTVSDVFGTLDKVQDSEALFNADIERIHCREPSHCTGNIDVFIPRFTTVAFSKQGRHWAVAEYLTEGIDKRCQKQIN